jgi:hypothetical protein
MLIKFVGRIGMYPKIQDSYDHTMNVILNITLNLFPHLQFQQIASQLPICNFHLLSLVFSRWTTFFDHCRCDLLQINQNQ